VLQAVSRIFFRDLRRQLQKKVEKRHVVCDQPANSFLCWPRLPTYGCILCWPSSIHGVTTVQYCATTSYGPTEEGRYMPAAIPSSRCEIGLTFFLSHEFMILLASGSNHQRCSGVSFSSQRNYLLAIRYHYAFSTSPIDSQEPPSSYPYFPQYI
jgi:hypothetical protein